MIDKKEEDKDELEENPSFFKKVSNFSKVLGVRIRSLFEKGDATISFFATITFSILMLAGLMGLMSVFIIIPQYRGLIIYFMGEGFIGWFMYICLLVISVAISLVFVVSAIEINISKDRTFIFSAFSALTTLVALIIAVIALFK